jgi:hypothetical protein
LLHGKTAVCVKPDARPAYPEKQRCVFEVLFLSSAINYILNSRNEHTSRLIHHCDELYVYALEYLTPNNAESRLENGKVSLPSSNGSRALRRSDFLEACFQNNSISHIYMYAPERQPNLETNYCYLSHCPINLEPPTTMICVSLTYSIYYS